MLKYKIIKAVKRTINKYKKGLATGDHSAFFTRAYCDLCKLYDSDCSACIMGLKGFIRVLPNDTCFNRIELYRFYLNKSTNYEIGNPNTYYVFHAKAIRDRIAQLHFHLKELDQFDAEVPDDFRFTSESTDPTLPDKEGWLSK